MFKIWYSLKNILVKKTLTFLGGVHFWLVILVTTSYLRMRE